jgi:hypothetical protein
MLNSSAVNHLVAIYLSFVIHQLASTSVWPPHFHLVNTVGRCMLSSYYHTHRMQNLILSSANAVSLPPGNMIDVLILLFYQPLSYFSSIQSYRRKYYVLKSLVSCCELCM